MQFLHRLKDVIVNLLVVLLYVLLAKIGLLLALKNPIITIFWPAGGFALAVLLLSEFKYLPGIFIGAVVAGFLAVDTPWVATMLGVADTVESFSAYWLLTRKLNFNPSLESRQDFFKLVLLSGGIASAISALIGPAALLVGNVTPESLYPTISLRWWMGDVLGIAFITPLVLIWRNPPRNLCGKLQALELLTLFASTFLIGQIVFFDWFNDHEYVPRGIAWIIPLVIWAGLRSGRHNTAALQLLLFIQALWAASHSIGHYGNDMVQSGLTNFWIFGIVLAVGGMALAIISFENTKNHKSLLESEEHFRRLFNANPDPAFITYMNGNLIDVNLAACESLGYNKVELLEMGLASIDAPEFRDKLPERIEELKNKGSTLFESAQIRKDGVIIPIEISSKIIYLLGQKVIFSVTRNLTERKRWENSIRESEDRLRLALSAGNQGWFDVNVKTGEVSVSPEYVRMIGYTPDTFHTSLDEWKISIHPDDRDAVMRVFQKCLVVGGPETMDYRRRSANGDWLWISSVGKIAEWDENHQPLRMIGTHTNITERKKTENRLQENEERLTLATLHNGVGIWDWNLKTMEMVWDNSMFALYHMRREDFSGTVDAWEKSLHPHDRERCDQEVQAALLDEKPFDTEFRVIWPNGEIHHIKAMAKVFRDDNGKPLRMLGTNIDISERKLLEDELKRQAHIDFLTGLSSRGYFMEQAEFELNRAVRYDNPLSLFMMDIDYFKQINDRHGHKIGDKVLVKLGEVCRNILREVDIIGRVGGEEFAILLPETNINEATEVAERLRVALANFKVSLQTGGLPIRFTVSIGLTSLSSKEDNLDVLFTFADKALYDAKHSGRNRVCVALQ